MKLNVQSVICLFVVGLGLSLASVLSRMLCGGKVKIGDLVRKPSSDRPRGVVGVIVDVTSRRKEGLIGVSWPDVEGVVYERPLSLDVIG